MILIQHYHLKRSGSFALNLSELVGKEIGGSYFSFDGAIDITHMTIGRYEDNDRTTTRAHGVNLSPHFTGADRNDILKYKIRAGFHTHPIMGVSVSDRTTPSGQDLERRNNDMKINPNFKSYILTQPLQYGGDFPHKIDYTNW